MPNVPLYYKMWKWDGQEKKRALVKRETWEQAGKSESLISCHCQKAGKSRTKTFFSKIEKLFLAKPVRFKKFVVEQREKSENEAYVSIKVLGGKTGGGWMDDLGMDMFSMEEKGWRRSFQGYVRALLSVSARHSLTSARAWMIPGQNRQGTGTQIWVHVKRFAHSFRVSHKSEYLTFLWLFFKYC